MHGLHEIITANAATSQMKPQAMTRQEKEELLKAFIDFLDDYNLSFFEYAPEDAIAVFLYVHGE